MNEMNFREMRRNDRQMTEEQAIEILKEQKWGVLAVCGDSGYPYGVPMNYGYVDEKIYMHSTSAESHKVDAIRRNEKVCLTIVEKEELDVVEYTTHYRSVIVFGKARILDNEAEKVAAMGKMMRGLVPAHVGNVMEHCGSVPSDFTMIEITLEHISGESNLQ